MNTTTGNELKLTREVASNQTAGRLARLIIWLAVIGAILLFVWKVGETPITEWRKKSTTIAATTQNRNFPPWCADAEDKTYTPYRGTREIRTSMRPQCFGGETMLPIDWPGYIAQGTVDGKEILIWFNGEREPMLLPPGKFTPQKHRRRTIFRLAGHGTMIFKCVGCK